MTSPATTPRILVNRSALKIDAQLVGVPANTCSEWTLIKNGKIVEASTNSISSPWQPRNSLTPGVYEVHAKFETSTGESEIIATLPMEFGQDLQSRPPRKARPARRNEYPPSFKELVFQEARKSYREPEYSAWLLDVKTNAYRFAETLGYKTPILETQPFTATAIPLVRGTVVKPLTGVMSQGVFLLGEEIRDLANGTTFSSLEDVRIPMNQLVESGKIKKDEWIREKLIHSDIDPTRPARDIKFYTFYGQVKLILETIRNDGLERCWYDQSLNTIDTGKYTKFLFPGNGVPLKYFQAAQEIGSNIPSPFVRIDFLASNDGVVLNEITPRPGGSNQFHPSVDRNLGETLIAADARLRRDLVNGKKFDAFNMVRLSS